MSLQLSQPGLVTDIYQSQSPPLPQRLGDRETIFPDGETSETWFLCPWIQRDTYHLEETEDTFIIYHRIHNALRKGGHRPIFRVLTSTKGNLLGSLGLFQTGGEGELGFPRDQILGCQKVHSSWVKETVFVKIKYSRLQPFCTPNRKQERGLVTIWILPFQ